MSLLNVPALQRVGCEEPTGQKAPTVQRTQSSLLSRKANEWLE